ncbi:MAG: glycosyltransferase [Firmicutes bacterium]|nr:glycosyltransferase [Bacillota bacterium]
MIVLLEPLADGDKAGKIDERIFQYYLRWSTSGHSGGPTVVAENLLKELRQRDDVAWMLVTPVTKLDRIYSVIWVVNDINHLVWAIENKEKLGCKQLWAGPNLVVVPQELQGIIGHSKVDKVIVPCRWPGEVYSLLMPSIREKIVIWPVGIDTDEWRPDVTKEKQLIVVYNKGNTALTEALKNGLGSAGEQVHEITYGKYSRSEYKALLDQAKAVVWLSATESQGIALLEAMAMNVPVLCWRNTVWNYYSVELRTVFSYDRATPAPYFSEQCGMFFNDAQDFFERQYPAFADKTTCFSPRRYLYDNNLVVGKSLTYIWD